MIGANINNLNYDMRLDALLFGESQSRIIISLDEKNLEKLNTLSTKYAIPVNPIGRVGGSKIVFNNFIDLDVDILKKCYYNTVSEIMNS